MSIYFYIFFVLHTQEQTANIWSHFPTSVYDLFAVHQIFMRAFRLLTGSNFDGANLQTLNFSHLSCDLNVRRRRIHWEIYSITAACEEKIHSQNTEQTDGFLVRSSHEINQQERAAMIRRKCKYFYSQTISEMSDEDEKLTFSNYIRQLTNSTLRISNNAFATSL